MSERDHDEPVLPTPIHLPFVGVKSALVRDWVRAMLVPPALERLYRIGMGVERFEVVTEKGTTFVVPANASVQVRALQAVIGVGVPQQLGLASEDGEAPGVLAVGEWELAVARSEVHGSASGPVEVIGPGESAEPYVPPEGHAVVVVEDAEATNDAKADEPPPPADPDRNALARAILAKRRARRAGPHDGPRAGDHPNHT